MERIITPEAVASYPFVFEPQKNEKDDGTVEEKYSVTLIFPEGTDLKPLKKAVAAVAKEKWGSKAGKVMQTARYPTFRTDVEEKGYPEGSTFISAKSKRQPGVVSTVPDPKTGKPSLVTDPESVYPGVIVRASVRPYAYDSHGNKGVSFALNNLQILRDGDRLDNYTPPEDEFEADENMVASLEDLEDEGATEDEGGDDLSELL